MTSVTLPTGTGSRQVDVHEARAWSTHPRPYSSRVALAAAHVVADPRGGNVPGAPAVIDWDSTLAFRRHLFEFGLGVAEAMDTAQRNMGLDWPAVQELIRRSAAQAHDLGARIASGAGTDHLPVAATLDDVERGYLEQVGFVESTGSQVIVMASRQLAAAATSADDYEHIYDTILSQVNSPVILHWLGDAFDPALAGYWGSRDIPTATDTFVRLVAAHADSIDGVKVSLLSAEHERDLRDRLPEGVRMYTGDDFNYPELIRGSDSYPRGGSEGGRYSDALLGAFAAIAPAASAALTALDAGDLPRYDAEFAPTLELSRTLFEAPTFYYKSGIAFLSWLNGHQPGFTMVGGLQSARSIVHLSRVFELADEARLLTDPDLAVARMRSLLATAGVDQ
jgi:hypothetical protein